MTAPASPPVVGEILLEHFEELGALALQRQRRLFAPDWDLPRLLAVERRAEAHRDALRIGGDAALRIARQALEGDDRGAAFAATLVLMESGRPDLRAAVLGAFRAAPPPARDGVRLGLRCSDVREAEGELRPTAAAGDPGVRVAAADVLAFHRRPAPPGLPDLLRVDEPAVRTLLHGAIGRFGGPWGIDFLQRALDAGEPEVRRSALEASARLGLPGLPDVCRRAAMRAPSPCLEALGFLGVFGIRDDLSLLENLLHRDDLAAASLEALGAAGYAESIPTVLRQAAIPSRAAAAARAFSRITGASVPVPAPAGDEAHPPDPKPLLDRWAREKGRFPAEGRMQAGLRLGADALGEPFDRLPLESRRDVYLGARALRPETTPDRELEAWGPVPAAAR